MFREMQYPEGFETVASSLKRRRIFVKGPTPLPPKPVLGSKMVEARRLEMSLGWSQYLEAEGVR
jgi:hypothetical protein